MRDEVLVGEAHKFRLGGVQAEKDMGCAHKRLALVPKPDEKVVALNAVADWIVCKVPSNIME
jgi:hypothetical protein